MRGVFPAAIVLTGMMLMTCRSGNISHTDSGSPCAEERIAAELIQDWYRHALYAERFSEGFRAPVVARMYAYVGIAAFETAHTNQVDGEQKIQGKYGTWHKPEYPAQAIYLPAALNACYARLMGDFFVGSAYAVNQDRLETQAKWLDVVSGCVSEETLRRSMEWGDQVAAAVYAWSASDSLGHRANLHNYDRSYVTDDLPGKWEPSPELPMPALLPYWKDVRTFLVPVGSIEIHPPLAYSEDRGSQYYTQAFEVYSLSTPLSDENKWIAEFWSDDLPGLTFSTAGRWISIVHQVIQEKKPDLTTILESYLKCGIAMNDAIVACWSGKYQYENERPETYIRKFIDPAWHPLHPAPPFPAYPSGHAAMGGAVCAVLTDLYGAMPFTDRSHAGRTEFRSKPRSFRDFDAMAHENAYSRLALGVHFRSDCEEGLRLGSEVGDQIAGIPVSAVEWKSDYLGIK